MLMVEKSAPVCVFPARAGMSPEAVTPKVRRKRVPRASGDEPARFVRDEQGVLCSPRERG